MDTNTKTNGQVKRLVLDIDGQKYALDPSITKDEALSLVDILSKGAKVLASVYASGAYKEQYYAENDVDISLRVTSAEIHPNRAAAKQVADAAAAAAKEVTL